jgi:hypothetical protein
MAQFFFLCRGGIVTLVFVVQQLHKSVKRRALYRAFKRLAALMHFLWITLKRRHGLSDWSWCLLSVQRGLGVHHIEYIIDQLYCKRSCCGAAWKFCWQRMINFNSRDGTAAGKLKQIVPPPFRHLRSKLCFDASLIDIVKQRFRVRACLQFLAAANKKPKLFSKPMILVVLFVVK